MKVIWEAEDIKPGVRYSRESIGEIWMIIRNPAEDQTYLSVSLADGVVGGLPMTKDLKAKTLTECEYMPVFVMDGLGIAP